MDPFWNKVFLGNTIRDWLIAAGIILVSLIVLRLVQAVLILRIKKFAATTKTSFDDFVIGVIQSSVMPLLYVLSVYFGLQYLTLPARVGKVLHVAIMLVVTFFILRLLTAFVTYAFEKAMRAHQGNQQREKQAKGILLIIRVIIWCLGILFLIDNLGYDITTLVAGLGIGGIAIALAAQTILGDLFSYLVIFFDKPFEIGDFIIVDEKMGSVEYIGIKTTHIRTLNGEQLIFSNTDLTNSRVHNYKRMHERRIVFSFGVTYDTPKEKLELIPQWIRKVVENMEQTRFDRAHFQKFGDSSLDFEVVYYVLSPDYNLYMDKQQHINLKLVELFSQQQIDFAFPTRTLYVTNTREMQAGPNE